MFEDGSGDLGEGDAPALGLGEAAWFCLEVFAEVSRLRETNKVKGREIDDQTLSSLSLSLSSLSLVTPSSALTFARQHVLDRVRHARGIVVYDELDAVRRDERHGRVVAAFR